MEILTFNIFSHKNILASYCLGSCQFPGIEIGEFITICNINGSVQDCCILLLMHLEISQSCAKPLISYLASQQKIINKNKLHYSYKIPARFVCHHCCLFQTWLTSFLYLSLYAEIGRGLLREEYIRIHGFLHHQIHKHHESKSFPQLQRKKHILNTFTERRASSRSENTQWESVTPSAQGHSPTPANKESKAVWTELHCRMADSASCREKPISWNNKLVT